MYSIVGFGNHEGRGVLFTVHVTYSPLLTQIQKYENMDYLADKA